jgi:hypothetical protein
LTSKRLVLLVLNEQIKKIPNLGYFTIYVMILENILHFQLKNRIENFSLERDVIEI